MTMMLGLMMMFGLTMLTLLLRSEYEVRATFHKQNPRPRNPLPQRHNKEKKPSFKLNQRCVEAERCALTTNQPLPPLLRPKADRRSVRKSHGNVSSAKVLPGTTGYTHYLALTAANIYSDKPVYESKRGEGTRITNTQVGYIL
jgi:hypothetical protein